MNKAPARSAPGLLHALRRAFVTPAHQSRAPRRTGRARGVVAAERPESLANLRRILHNTLTRLGAVMSEKEGRVSGTRLRVSVPVTELGLLLIFVLLAAAGSL